MYCIYSDLAVPSAGANFDHVIPLALGGTNDFQVPSSTSLNGRMSSEIEGPLANDFFIHVARSRAEVTGHSGRIPRARTKQARILGPGPERPASLEFGDKEGVQVWDPIEKRYLLGEEIDGLQIRGSASIDLSLRVRFAAKVALGAGYYVYGDRFRRAVDHEELRTLMWSYTYEMRDTLRDLKTRVCDAFSEVAPADREVIGILRAFCETAAGSCVILGVGPSNLLIAVGVLRQFIGLVNVPARPGEFTESEGLALVVKDGRLKPISLDRAMAQLQRGIEEAQIRSTGR